ncbi:MAG TPA: SDR family NAD(P)-dependent oxidoreductase, partial [Steroidobacteraceae bacterium]|nr:SDR family NAD(P)-dependent oxidoreductase [Steroidobacteraceae bacterium]
MGTQAQRIAYVTGGMGGIGTAICRRLCRDGITVIAGCGPGSARKDRWLSDMRAEGFNIHASEGNVSDWDSTKRAFEVARAEVGPIDILVNNAGITRDGTFQKMTNEAWHAV